MHKKKGCSLKADIFRLGSRPIDIAFWKLLLQLEDFCTSTLLIPNRYANAMDLCLLAYGVITDMSRGWSDFRFLIFSLPFSVGRAACLPVKIKEHVKCSFISNISCCWCKADNLSTSKHSKRNSLVNGFHKTPCACLDFPQK